MSEVAAVHVGVEPQETPLTPESWGKIGMWLFLAGDAMSFLLIVSSVWMVLSLSAIQKGDLPKFKKFMGLVILGGLVFLGCQAYEWTHLITEVLPHHNLAFGKDLFATTFFVLTGFHGLHVTGGVIYNTCVLAAVSRGRYQAKHVEIAGLYWHFVDLVWILIFTFVYLL